MPEDLPISCRKPEAGPATQGLKEMEKEHIQRILEENGWNIVRSAKILGIDRSTLYSKIRRYQLQKSE
jgi:transcriptional regulator of acetoin/glycerol metabolism